MRVAGLWGYSLWRVVQFFECGMYVIAAPLLGLFLVWYAKYTKSKAWLRQRLVFNFSSLMCLIYFSVGLMRLVMLLVSSKALRRSAISVAESLSGFE